MIDLQETHKHCAMPRTRNGVEIKSEESFLFHEIFHENVINSTIKKKKNQYLVRDIKRPIQQSMIFLMK